MTPILWMISAIALLMVAYSLGNLTAHLLRRTVLSFRWWSRRWLRRNRQVALYRLPRSRR